MSFHRKETEKIELVARPVLPGHFLPVLPDDDTDSGRTKPDENPKPFSLLLFFSSFPSVHVEQEATKPLAAQLRILPALLP